MNLERLQLRLNAVSSKKPPGTLLSSYRKPEAYKCLVMTRGTFVVLWLTLASATCNYSNILWEHQCDAGSEVFACSIPDFYYMPGQNSSRVVETNSTVMRRLSITMNRIRKYKHHFQHIFAYDAVLHEKLKSPRAIQMSNTRVRLLEVPIDLEYAEFTHGYLQYLVVTPSEAAYRLRFLNLEDNIIDDLRNLSTLVNLETLNLSGNWINYITNQMFRRMANLTTLILSNNHIEEINFHMLPPSVENFNAQDNLLFAVYFDEAYLPELKDLHLSHGQLLKIDVTALLAAAPKLKKISLLHNQFDVKQQLNISATLKAAGVAHEDSFGEEKTDQHKVVSDSGDVEEEYFKNYDDSFYRDRKAQFWEHTIAWLLAIGNSIVLVWAAVGFFREKQQAKPCNTATA